MQSINIHGYSLVVSMITPVAALFLPPAVIAEPSDDDGTVNIKLNVSFCPSANISSITGTITLLVVIPLSNVVVSVVVLKSTPPVSQTLFSQHIIIHITLLPSADTGDFSNGVTVTLNGLLDVPPTSSNVITTNPVDSEPVYCVCVNLTLIVEESIIIPVALVTGPATTPGPSDDDTVKLILNISSPSTMLSLVTATLTVVLVAPAGIVAVRGIVLKSLPKSCIYLIITYLGSQYVDL